MLQRQGSGAVLVMLIPPPTRPPTHPPTHSLTALIRCMFNDKEIGASCIKLKRIYDAGLGCEELSVPLQTHKVQSVWAREGRLGARGASHTGSTVIYRGRGSAWTELRTSLNMPALQGKPAGELRVMLIYKPPTGGAQQAQQAQPAPAPEAPAVPRQVRSKHKGFCDNFLAQAPPTCVGGAQTRRMEASSGVDSILPVAELGAPP